MLARRGLVAEGVRVRYFEPADGKARAGLGDDRKVGGDAVDAERLECAASVQAAAPAERVVRCEAVDEAEGLRRVLGQVSAAAAVEGDRLVFEAPERYDRLGVAAVPGVDLEDVAVRLLEHLERLLAGQPGAPRRRTAAAVVERTRQADLMAE